MSDFSLKDRIGKTAIINKTVTIAGNPVVQTVTGLLYLYKEAGGNAKELWECQDSGDDSLMQFRESDIFTCLFDDGSIPTVTLNPITLV